jgi:uncharacterized membrane protein YbhN (UPF0104 family)
MKRLNRVIAAVAVMGLAILSARLGRERLAEQLAAVSSLLPLLAAFGIARTILQTLAWSKALRAEGIDARFFELLVARVCSRSVGYLSVSGPIVAEPLRISMLRHRSETATAATLIDTGAYWFSSGIFGILGSFYALRFLGRPQSGALVVLAAITFAGLLLIARPKPVLPTLVRLLGRRCPQSLTRAVVVEAAIRAFQARHPRSIRSILALGLACQALIAAEAVAVLACLQIPFSVGTILAIEAASRIVKFMGGLVPARIGTDESGMAAAFMAFGLPTSSGLALALARRMRDLIEAGLGIAWFSWISRRPQRRCPTLPGTRLASA